MAKASAPYKPRKSLLKAISEVIRQERNKQKLTQEELANKANLHWRYIQRIEKERMNISISVFYDLAQALNINPVKLLKKVIAIL